ncbi:MAG: aldo/keto reductase [Cyanobacteria bacterium P01_G01_bin.49]
MEITLGKSDLKVSQLGIGTWAWGDRLFWGYGQEYGPKEVKEAYQTAIKKGVTFFDTAEVYGLGESERLLGQFLQESSQPIQIATKYFPLPWRFGKQAVSDALTASLNRLQVPQIALYQVHTPFDFFMGQETLMEALADEVKKGRIQTVGVSNYSAQQMEKAHELLAKYDVTLAVNQTRYSLLTRKIEENGVLEMARKLNVTILAYSPLDQGLLTGKYTPETLDKLQGARRLDPKFSVNGLQKIEPVLNLLKQLGQTYQKTPAQIALNWLICQENVIPIPGAKTASQAEDNGGALSWRLESSEVEKLRRVAESL